MIKIKNLDFSYPDSGFRIRIPTLEIGKGDRIALAGPSGSGKTTLLNLMAGIIVPQSGLVSLGEKLISSETDAARRRLRLGKIGFVFQDFGLIEYLPIHENIMLPALVNRTVPISSDLRKRAVQLCSDMGLPDDKRKRVEKLSQGEKQRVAICRAVLTSPEYIFADEPTGNLDSENGAMVMDLLYEQASANGSTLIVVTHDPLVLERFETVVKCEAFRETEQ